MKATIKNISGQPQSVPCINGLQIIEPGQTRTLDVAPEYVERLKALPFMMVDGDDNNVGIEPRPRDETEAIAQMRSQHDLNRADDIAKLKASEKLVADQKGLLSERDAEIASLKQQMSRSPLVKLVANSSGGDSYFVMDAAGKEVLQKLSKAEAEAFNAMSIVEQAAYLATNKIT